MDNFRKPYKFPAIVGQEKLKTAFLANIVNPDIGGLLISGPKGTGKSTVVHSVENLLPDYRAVDDCRFNCDPDRPERFCSLCREKDQITATTRKMKIITLPLSCTEDRLIGSIDIERLLKTGEKKVEAGILGEANRNILYIDEVNLLPDHLVDDILDAAALPWNTIEREGISIFHPAEFILIGTMNPEEGELRPQILDRFPICVKVESIMEPKQRVEIVKRNLLFESDPEKYSEIFEADERIIADTIIKARDMLSEVRMAESYLYAVAEACGQLKVDGQRPDIIIVKTAITIAALDSRRDIGETDILLAAEFTLSHRTRDGGLLGPPSLEEIRDVFTKYLKKMELSKTTGKNIGHITTKSADIDKDADEFVELDDKNIEPENITLKKKRNR